MEILYQPVVNLANSAPVKLEAFYRPTQPVGEVKDFIASTERSGGIKALLQETMDGAFSDWPKINRPFIQLSLNISIANLDEDDLPKRMAKSLKKHRFDAKNLWLELDEAMQGINDPKRIARMKNLAEMGLRFSVDSFGTEISQSTLYDLQRLPIGELKLDGRIVSDADINMEHRGEVKMAVDIAKQIHVGVSAKGIERAEIASLMLRLGCTYGQGYYYARPAPAREIAAVIDRLRQPGA